MLSPSSWHYLAAALRLSPREREIVRHIFDDHKELAIGQALGISPHTVNTYLQRLYHKLHVSSREQLIVRVMAEHLAHTVGQIAPGAAADGPVEPGSPLGV